MSTPDDSHTPQPTAEQAPHTDTPKAEPAPQPEAPAPRRRKFAAGALIIDTLLVGTTVGVLAFGAYYLKLQMDRYHVPTPLEQALEEQAELRARANRLAEAKAPLLPQNRLASGIKALESRLAELDKETRDLRVAIEQHKDKLENERAAVLAAQHDIRRANKEARSVARSLLPGLVIAKLATVSGREYPQATIIRVKDGKLVLRYPGGSASVPLSSVDMNSLPEIARYAFDRLDLVDMSDFVKGKVSPESFKKPKATPALTIEKPKKSTITVEYDPGAGTPTLDTDSGRTSTTTDPSAGVEEAVPADGAPWEAPIDALPL